VDSFALGSFLYITVNSLYYRGFIPIA